MDSFRQETHGLVRFYTKVEIGGTIVEDDEGQDFGSEPEACAKAMAALLDVARDWALHLGTRMITARVFNSDMRPVYHATLTLNGDLLG